MFTSTTKYVKNEQLTRFESLRRHTKQNGQPTPGQAVSVARLMPLKLASLDDLVGNNSLQVGTPVKFQRPVS
jgi:hypothetical protein